MAEPMKADTDGLITGAAASESIASSLGAADFVSYPGSQPSHDGVAAVNRAISTIRTQQATRVQHQADALRTGAARYDDADLEAADNLAESM